MTETEISIKNDNDVASCRESAAMLAQEMGFDALTCGEITLAVSEIAQNVVNHAIEGKASIVSCNEGRILKITIQDQGQGTHNVKQAMVEGFSTSPTSLGLGLQVAKRSMDSFQITSIPNKGTTVIMEKYIPLKETQIEYGIASAADSRYHSNGDVFLIKEFDGNKVLVAIIDGPGQGQSAKEIALIAKGFLQDHFKLPLEELVQKCHFHLQKQKVEQGVTMSIVLIEPRELTYCGIGDTHGHLFGQTTSKQFTHAFGLVGGDQKLKPKIYNKHLHANDFVVLCTDGVRNGIVPEELQKDKHAQEVATGIFNTHVKPYGDATILIIKYKQLK